MEKIKFRIGGVVAEITSAFKLCHPCYGEDIPTYRYFIDRGTSSAKVKIEVKPLDFFPVHLMRGARRLFTTTNPIRKEVAWTLYETQKRLIINFRLTGRKKIMVLSKNYTTAVVYMRGKRAGFSWSIEDILYDCLQIALIGYLADKQGIIVHSAGIKNSVGRGFIFAGRSGAGKSTTARLWHGHGRSAVLNDDRILVKKMKNKFIFFGTPWHGDFNGYSASIAESAPLDKFFFIYHRRTNKAEALTANRTFAALYPTIFPVFWDRKRLEDQVSLCRSLAVSVPGYSLGFAKNRSVVGFVRSII